MKIDIISYTDEQYAALASEQILEVQSAQLKKNKLDAAFADALEKEKNRLSARGLLQSSYWELFVERLSKSHEQEVENLRAALLFYLRFTTRPDENVAGDAPYTVNYAMTIAERLAVVRTYYDTKYADGAERFAAFKADKIAPNYLGEEYAPLYDYYLSLAN